MQTPPPKPPESDPGVVQLPRYTKEEMLRIMAEKDPELLAQCLREFLKNKQG